MKAKQVYEHKLRLSLKHLIEQYPDAPNRFI